jgi:hypothetical protein
MCLINLYLIEHFILSYKQHKKGYSYLSLIHEYMTTHIKGIIFYINNNIINIF